MVAGGVLSGVVWMIATLLPPNVTQTGEEENNPEVPSFGLITSHHFGEGVNLLLQRVGLLNGTLALSRINHDLDSTDKFMK